jgi:hypothetical protein
VLATKIFAFSNRLGWLSPIFLSRMKPSSKYESTSFPPAFLMIWMLFKFVFPFNLKTASTASFAK